MIHVLIPCYNCEEWIERCVESAINQVDVDPFTIEVIDDASTDRTREIVESLGVKVWTNERNQKCPLNIYEAVGRSVAVSDDVFFLLDGDDFLPHNRVLSRIEDVYENPNVWITYGNYQPWPKNTGQTLAQAFPSKVVRNRSYREDGRMLFNHPITFRRFLFDAIDPSDLQDEDGKWFTVGYDQAIILPMMEMAGPRFRFLDEHLYTYNAINPESDATRTVPREDWDAVERIWKRRKKPMLQ